MYQQISISSIFLGLLICSTCAEEVLIQIVVKKPINIVSDRYVSFSIDPGHLLDLCLRPSNFENATILANNRGSAYFKISGSNSNQFTLDDETISVKENQVRIIPSDWQMLYQWLNRTNLKPIISLPYSSERWSPRNIISILGISNRLGIRNCIWQLGSELNSTETIIDYVDDLSTFKSILDVFRKNGNDWGVIGADISAGCKADELDLYADLARHISRANAWTQSIEYNSHDDKHFLEKDPVLRSLLRSKIPTWYVPQYSQYLRNERCGLECELQGIRWANTLGSSAQNGFKVVFQRVDKSELRNPSLSYYVSRLHKKTMGRKVFDTKILNGDDLSPKYFTHCTKNMSGSFSVMGVNFADYKTKISTNLPNKYTGSEAYQYVLNVDGGRILLNGNPVNMKSDLQPIIISRKQSRSTTFTLPPRSIGFWVFPLANLKQCSTKADTEIASPVKEDSYDDLEISSKTASEKLLHELIAEIIQIDSARNEIKRPERHAIVKKDSKHINRIKRNVDTASITGQQVNNLNYNNRFSKLFKTFELPQPKIFKFPNFWTNLSPKQNPIAQNPAAIPPVATTINDIYRVDPSEQIFKSVENSELPTKDVYLRVGKERNMDYVEFDDKEDKLEKQHSQNRHQMVKDYFDEDNDEARERTTPDMIPYTELWESDVYQKAPPPEAADEQSILDQVQVSNNHERNIDLVIQELPPTFRQNQEKLNEAKSKLDTIYVNDGDRMTSTNIKLPVRHIDMDEDGFFVSKRKRRSINADFNDEIEKKVNNLKKAYRNNGEKVEEYTDFLNKNDSNINLLEKITKLIESLEKIDDIGKHSNIEKLNSEIKELENLLFRKSSKFGLLKPKNKATRKEIRRKCKILSTNLEQQCLKENDFHPSRLLSRDAKRSSDDKAKKMSSLKNADAKKSENLNRIRRNTAYDSSSWETDDRNMILKELYTANEFNDFVPAISFQKPTSIDYQPNEGRREYIEQVAVLQHLPNSFSPSSVVQVATQQRPRPVPTFAIDTNLDGRIIEKDIDENPEEKEYPAPKFMKKISNTVQDWMNVVEKHVSGWWHLLN